MHRPQRNNEQQPIERDIYLIVFFVVCPRSLRPHPNVVLFLGITVPPSPMCIVVEFCEGGSLYDLIHKKSKHKLTDIDDMNTLLRIATEIAKGE